jgi:uncharacterized membrane protein
MHMAIMLLGLAMFLGIHSIRIVYPSWREERIAGMGEGRWRGIYSLISLIGLVLLVFGYAYAQPLAPVIYVAPFWLVHLTALLMAFSFIALMVFNFPAGKLKPMLKHPFLVAVKIWALAHLLVNGDLASLILFGAFLAWAVWDRVAVKRRGESLPPPGPVINDLYAVAAGLLLWFVFVWKLHEWLIGVPVPIT